jgi:uncharacterized protein YggT (Ycf19 family)
LQAPRTDFTEALFAIMRPIIAPFKRVIPMLGPLDLSIAVCMLCLTIAHQLAQLGLQQLVLMMAGA